MLGTTAEFYPFLISITHSHHLQNVTDDPLSLQQLIQFNHLDLFINSFLSATPSIWSSLQLALQEREVLPWAGVLFAALYRGTFSNIILYDCVRRAYYKENVTYKN